MNALEELRNLIPPYVSGDDIGGPEDLILCDVKRIADRIEAEYTELPKDAGGEVIHVGDMVELRYGSGEIVEVYGVNDHAVYTQIGCHGADLVKLSKHETIDDVRNEITSDWDYAHDLIDRAYECGKPDPSNGDANYCAYCGAKGVDDETL